MPTDSALLTTDRLCFPAMDVKTFNTIRRIVYEQSGIDLPDGKASMVASRLAKRLRALNLEDELAYVEYLEQSMDEELVHLLNAISTNVTAFFREPHHFQTVRQAMAKWLKAGQTRFRFWSAASSTGQEPYSLAMTLLEIARLHGRPLDMKILATDISTRVLAQAQAGEYNFKESEGIPEELRKRYIEEFSDGKENKYRVREPVRDLVVFRRMNLSTPPFPMKGPMDVIFCRNVMIYFNDKVRDKLIREFHRMVRPDGYLLIGHAESLTNWDDLFTHQGSTTYQPLNK